jgi:hypothetical protein
MFEQPPLSCTEKTFMWVGVYIFQRLDLRGGIAALSKQRASILSLFMVFATYSNGTQKNLLTDEIFRKIEIFTHILIYVRYSACR